MQVIYKEETNDFTILDSELFCNIDKFGWGMQCSFAGDEEGYQKVKEKCFELRNLVKELIEINKVIK